jgi:hypothetical protein
MVNICFLDLRVLRHASSASNVVYPSGRLCNGARQTTASYVTITVIQVLSLPVVSSISCTHLRYPSSRPRSSRLLFHLDFPFSVFASQLTGCPWQSTLVPLLFFAPSLLHGYRCSPRYLVIVIAIAIRLVQPSLYLWSFIMLSYRSRHTPLSYGFLVRVAFIHVQVTKSSAHVDPSPLSRTSTVARVISVSQVILSYPRRCSSLSSSSSTSTSRHSIQASQELAPREGVLS